MKQQFIKSLIALYKKKEFVFLTADLGYNMLEPLREVMGDHFINCGIAEQNMVGMAAGIAKAGTPVFCYSIAPFLYARAFEQIRNDVCFNDLPVFLVGAGGGYGYGVLGQSHHAIEDYGTLLTLPNIHCYIPAFADDIEPIIERMVERNRPAYLRLGKCEKPEWWDSANNCLEDLSIAVNINSNNKVVLCGAIAGKMMKDLGDYYSYIIVKELPMNLYLCVEKNDVLIIVEEHVRQGGLGQILGLPSLNAVHFPSDKYGSQQWMREQAGLTADNVIKFFDGEKKCG